MAEYKLADEVERNFRITWIRFHRAAAGHRLPDLQL